MSAQHKMLAPDARGFPFGCNLALQKDLQSEGWLTPNSYGRDYAPVENKPGVYLFVVVDDYDYRRSFVGYAGMSSKLLQRITGHPVKAELDDLGLYVATYFKLTPACDLRDFERVCIRRFVPPWNIIGKPRGVIVS